MIVYKDKVANELPVMIVEVHSSPFQQTIMKCILGVVDQLRLIVSFVRPIHHYVHWLCISKVESETMRGQGTSDLVEIRVQIYIDSYHQLSRHTFANHS